MPTFIQYPGDGENRIFSVQFTYLNPTHVKVSINGIVQVNGADYDFTGVSTIQFRQYRVPTAGTVVEVRRVTPVDDLLVVFQNSAVLTAEDLNTATRQLFNLAQEIRDVHEARIESGLSRVATGDFTNAQDMIDAITQEILDSALLADLNSRITDIDANAESILQQTARLDLVQNVVDTLLEIDGVGIATYILNVEQAMIVGDEALAARIALIGAESGGGTAFILDLNSVLASPTQSLATKFSLIEAGIDENADGVADNVAAISIEATARANGDSAIASDITTLQARVTDTEGDISTASVQISANATAILGLDGTVDTLTAQFMVKTDVNGYVSGFGLYNTGATSEFIVLADKFAVVTPGVSPTVPFAITGGVVYMQNVVIGGALIEDLSVGTIKIASGAITNSVLGTGGSTSIIPTFNAWVNVGSSMSISTAAGSKLLVWGGVTLRHTPASAQVEVRVVRVADGAVVGGGPTWFAPGSGDVPDCQMTVFGVDTSTLSGSNSYRIQVFVTTGAATGTMTSGLSHLIGLETKR